MTFYPGPGLGGHCIPIDPFYLTWKAKKIGFETKFIKTAGIVNNDVTVNIVKKIKKLSKNKKDSRIVMLTGYGNLPTAVAAVKAGAIDYIAKPVDADDVESALLASPESKAKPPENPMSADRVKWEHIHRVFELCNRNVSETARRLKMHRRTLQRILSKRSPR